MKFNYSRQGFTLIELLTVVAIIAILAAITAVALPRAREKAKIVRVENDFRQLQVALTQYAVEHGSYPPMYGYRKQQSRNVSDDKLILNQYYYFFLVSYMTMLGLEASYDLYDEFSSSYDTDARGGAGTIDPLEFSPIYDPDEDPEDSGDLQMSMFLWPNYSKIWPAVIDPQVDIRLFDGLDDEDEPLTGEKLDGKDRVNNREFARPYVYIPVNMRQAELVRRYYEGELPDTYYTDVACNSTPGSRKIDARARGTLLHLNLRFPPPKYDAYVLISVSPAVHTRGILMPPNLDDFKCDHWNDLKWDDADYYHYLGLRAYYLATRDLNDNGELDFDFRARSRRREGAADLEKERTGGIPANYVGPAWTLPDGSAGYGPMIFKQEG